jgi:hypothetical protein
MPIKTIRIKKAGGGTRLQKVKVLKSGKYKFIKNTRKTTTRKRRTTKARKGELTLKRKQAYPRTIRRRAATRKRSKGSDWSDW